MAEGRLAGKVAVRARGGVDLGAIELDAFVERLHQDIAAKRSQPQLPEKAA